MADLVAIFWDFEQLHQRLFSDRYGNGRSQKNQNRAQARLVNVQAVMDQARTHGQVIWNEAYANWRWMGRYRSTMTLEEVTFVQVFPDDPAQLADVFPLLGVRARQLVRTNEDISDVVLVGLDDDYSSLVEDLRAMGCRVHCIGPEGEGYQRVRSVCDTYHNYYQLPGVTPAEKSGNKKGDRVKYYLRVAAQQGVRMPPPQMMWIGIDIYASFLTDYEQFTSFKELDEECFTQLQRELPAATMTEVKKIRQVLFKCYLFRPSEDGLISFHEDIKGLADIENCYFTLMLHRIAENLDEEVDYAALSRALTAAPDSAERLEKLHQEIRKS